MTREEREKILVPQLTDEVLAIIVEAVRGYANYADHDVLEGFVEYLYELAEKSPPKDLSIYMEEDE